MIGVRADARVDRTGIRDRHHAQARVLDRLRVAVARWRSRVAWRLFPLAIPLVNLDITMSRAEAIAQGAKRSPTRLHARARRRAQRRRASRTTATTQNYVELEGGGKRGVRARWSQGDRLRAVLVGRAAVHARRGRARSIDPLPARRRARTASRRRVPETYVRDAATKALDAAAARALAEDARARRTGSVDLAPYTLLEQSQQTRPSGRVDHAFVYRARRDARRGAHPAAARGHRRRARPRSRRTCTCPKSFERRFRELRSANNTIAGRRERRRPGCSTASAAASSACCGSRASTGSLWRPALVAGLVVGGAAGATTLAGRAGARGSASTPRNRRRRSGCGRSARRVLVAVGGGLGVRARVHGGGEPDAPRVSAPPAAVARLVARGGADARRCSDARSAAICSCRSSWRSIAAFYYATNRWLGWWQPSEVADRSRTSSRSRVPALTPIAMSLQAGFMEECLFRAVPLSLGALIGARFGRRTLGIAHRVRAAGAGVRRRARQLSRAFPSYSRLVELVLPSMLWALDLPALRPAADDPAARAVRSRAVLDPAVPRRRAGRAAAARAGHRRGARAARRSCCGGAGRPAHGASCRRRFATARGRRGAAARPMRRGRSAASAARPPVAGVPARAARARLAGLAAWVAFTPIHADVPPLRSIARRPSAAADAALAARGVDARTANGSGSSTVQARERRCAQWTRHKFVWREAGADAYRALVGTTLAPPLWEVRYAMFDGDVADARRGVARHRSSRRRRTCARCAHALPEARPGARLDARRGAGARRAHARDALRRRSRAAEARRAPTSSSGRRAPTGRSCSPIRASTSARTARRATSSTIAGDEVVRRRTLRARARDVAARRARARQSSCRSSALVGGRRLLRRRARRADRRHPRLDQASRRRAVAADRVRCDARRSPCCRRSTAGRAIAMQLETTEPLASQLTIADPRRPRGRARSARCSPGCARAWARSARG